MGVLTKEIYIFSYSFKLFKFLQIFTLMGLDFHSKNHTTYKK